eukprot:43432-Eustigmatos_ZCMA.PRE.1
MVGTRVHKNVKHKRRHKHDVSPPCCTKITATAHVPSCAPTVLTLAGARTRTSMSGGIQTESTHTPRST